MQCFCCLFKISSYKKMPLYQAFTTFIRYTLFSNTHHTLCCYGRLRCGNGWYYDGTREDAFITISNKIIYYFIFIPRFQFNYHYKWIFSGINTFFMKFLWKPWNKRVCVVQVWRHPSRWNCFLIEELCHIPSISILNVFGWSAIAQIYPLRGTKDGWCVMYISIRWQNDLV